MLDIKFIRENRDIVEMAMKNKKVKEVVDLDKLFDIYDKKKDLKTKIEEINTQKNIAAKEQNIEEGRRLKEEGSKLESEHTELEKEFIRLMLLIPNIPSADTPIGKDDSDNQVARQWGEIPTFSFTPKEHFDIAETLGLIDKEKAAEVSGSRFAFIKGDLALLQFAIINFCMSIVTDESILKVIAEEAGLDVSTKPFVPVIPPVMVKSAVFNRMGRLEPREDKYYLEEDDLFLVGSAEHTLGPIHMDEILEEKDLPIRYLGYSSAFRREAGTYGKDTKGILRMHQFDKLEMETFCLPETSRQEQDFLVAIQEYFLRKLKIPYQVVKISTGDMGIPDHRQIDLEAWMPGQNTYRETHTSDLMTTFQSRRLNTKFKRDGKTELVHMNDATLSAIGRTMIAIIENYQKEDGTIGIPEVLQKYMGGRDVIK